MFDADAIEAIHFEQLALIDRQILRKGRVSQHRLITMVIPMLVGVALGLAAML